MKITTKVNAGGLGLGNHNENLVRDCARALKAEIKLNGTGQTCRVSH